MTPRPPSSSGHHWWPVTGGQRGQQSGYDEKIVCQMKTASRSQEREEAKTGYNDR